MKRGSLATILLIANLALAPIRITAYPSASTAPADVRLTITTLPNSDNVETCYQYDSDGGDAGLSCWDMLGDREPVTKQVWLKGLHSGEYEVVVTLIQHSGKRYTDRTQFIVN